MTIPSIATLKKRGFSETAKILHRLLSSSDAVREHSAAIALKRASYNPPSLMQLRLEALNAAMKGYGVEYVKHGHNQKSPGFHYINMGDTYNTTIVRLDDGRYAITSWGDIKTFILADESMKRNPRRRSISVNTYRGADFSNAAYILRKHYDLGRALTTTEVKVEIDNLIRKREKGNLDTSGKYLASSIFKNPRKPRRLGAHAPGVRAMLAKHARAVALKRKARKNPIKGISSRLREARKSRIASGARERFALQVYRHSKDDWYTLGGTFTDKTIAIREGKELHKSMPTMRLRVIAI